MIGPSDYWAPSSTRTQMNRSPRLLGDLTPQVHYTLKQIYENITCKQAVNVLGRELLLYSRDLDFDGLQAMFYCTSNFSPTIGTRFTTSHVRAAMNSGFDRLVDGNGRVWRNWIDDPSVANCFFCWIFWSWLGGAGIFWVSVEIFEKSTGAISARRKFREFIWENPKNAHFKRYI